MQKNNNSDKLYIHGRVSASVSPDVHSPARDGPCFHIRDRAAALMYKDDARGTRARGRERKRGMAKRRGREIKKREGWGGGGEEERERGKRIQRKY